jgi:uncharacterized damage-inducible protein DinB
MKELLLSYAGHNAWANDQLLGAIAALTPAQQQQELVSSFPTVQRTLLHLVDSNTIWWQRLQLQEKITRPSDSFEGDFAALAQILRKIDSQWLEYVQRSHEHVFTHEFIYRDNKGVQHKSPVWQVLQHLFNHGTFHRGQLVTMLRQLGLQKIPATDYIVYAREKIKR